MAGNGWTGGYANCIKENHPDVTITNLAVTGKMLINNEIFQQLIDYASAGGTQPDILLIDGGGNDCINRVELGTANLDSSYPSGWTATTCDSLESMIYNIKTVYPFTKLLFIMPYPMMQWVDENGTDVIPGVPAPSMQRKYYDEIEKVLMKWGVPIVDLYRNSNLTSANMSQLANFFMGGTDTLHLNEAGYRRVAPVIEDALKKLF
jgi:lysophospholipase L1-like esterase